MWNQVLICVSILLVNVHSSTDRLRSRLVETQQGPVRGYAYEDSNVITFYNIPYATVPEGVDKFKAPLRPPTWNETFHALNRGIVCPQTMLQPLPYDRREDCLVANIHIPDTEETNLPVLVIVHQAAFLDGNAHMSSPNFFVETKQIIAVTFNYRMGANGFLCLGTAIAPGNAGLWDQVALLRWVRDNIAGFGGNPDDVTVGGCLSGVDLLVQSQMTDGLIHKVISDSQCSLNSVEFDPLKTAQDRAVNGFNFQTPNDLTALEEFYEIYTSLLTNNFILGLGEFKPCVEKDVGQLMFLDDAPINILRNGSFKQLPIMFGYSKLDAFRLHGFNKTELNEAFYKVLPVDLKFASDEQRTLVAEAAKQFYFGGEVNDTDVLAYLNYITDINVYPILRAVSYQVSAGNNQVYLHEYSFTDQNSPAIPQTEERGSSHCDQFRTAFGLGVNPTEERLALSKTLRDLYINFITTGNPTPPGTNSSLPAWLPVSGADRSPHYSIGNTIKLAGVPMQESAAFWDRVYLENDVRVPIPPRGNSATLNVNSIWSLCIMLVLLVIG